MMTTIRAVFVAFLVVLATIRGNAQGPSPLRLLVSSYGILPPAYIAPPPSPAFDYLLVGESPVFQLNVRVVNDGQFTRVLDAPRRTLNVIVQTFPGKQTIDVPMPDVSGPVRVFGTGSTAVAWDEHMPLAPREYLEWTVKLQVESLQPGIYSIEAILPSSDDTGREIVRGASAIYIEIRNDPSEEAANEMALRAAVRLLGANRLSEALAVAADATMRFPNSVIVMAWLGEIYEKLGQRVDAYRTYSRALAVLEAGQEHPMPFRPRDTTQTMLYLRSKIAKLN